MVCVIVTTPYIKYICQVHIVSSIKFSIPFLVSQMHIPHTSMWNVEQNCSDIPIEEPILMPLEWQEHPWMTWVCCISNQNIKCKSSSFTIFLTCSVCPHVDIMH